MRRCYILSNAMTLSIIVIIIIVAPTIDMTQQQVPRFLPALGRV